MGMEGSNYVYRIIGIEQERNIRRNDPGKVRMRKPLLPSKNGANILSLSKLLSGKPLE